MIVSQQMRPAMDAYRLCYVDGPWAWFTTAPLSQQWGDDWNDAPYEHNAGDPYGWRDERGVERYELLKIAWEGPLETPDAWHHNSPWSVEQINAGAVPWLVTARYTSGPQVAIAAGAPFWDVLRLIGEAGGTVYLAGL